MRIITRRSAVAAGIGALSLVPTAAMAAALTRLGYRAGGEAYEGLVTVEGSTYLYLAGVMYKGGAIEYKGSRWFSPEDGRMAVDEDVEWPDGTIHRYGPDGVMIGGAATAPVTEKELAAGWYTLTLASGESLRLDVEGARAADGSRVYLQAADDGRGIEQKIRITWPDAQRVKIESAMGVLGPAEGSAGGGDAVTQSAEKGTEAERWYPERAEDGACLFRNAVNGGVLSVPEPKAGAEARCMADTGSGTQRWMLTPCAGFTGWWTDADGSAHCTDPSSALMIRSSKREDPYLGDFGSVYDFDEAGVAAWHLPTYDDVPGGCGEDAPIPTPRGDRRQRALILAISRIGCPYELGAIPRRFVCDGLSGWCYETATGDTSYSGDASWQWQMVKDRNGIKADMGSLTPGDLVFFGNPQVTYGPGSIDYNGEAYHAGVYYADGKMINARGEGGVQLTDIGWYDGNMMRWLGGGSPYEAETSMTAIGAR